MKDTTLCYIEKDDKYLMLYRNKKQNDVNSQKYVGIGGHFEKGESPYDCVIREVKEETNLTLISPEYRGIVTFVSNIYEDEQMHLFTCRDYIGEIGECDEGELKWIEKSNLKEIPMWAGDIVFLDLLEKNIPFFSLKLSYKGDTLVDSYLNGKKYKKATD